MSYRSAWVGGTVLAIVLVSGGCASHHDDTGAAASDAAWTKSFPVKKENLGPTGSNSYFELVPGTVCVFKDKSVTLTITVTDATRVVDGVTTRVIEEREMQGEKPKEISRNFFAIDSASGDVYYFGEEVDEYKNGTVTHPGVWVSGVSGAHFVLMMPSHPKAGERFYQELAPGVAMDRFEIVSVSETVTVPAGTFKNCVHMKETSPLESGAGHKWYAPGVGLVKDGDAELASRKPGKP